MGAESEAAETTLGITVLRCFEGSGAAGLRCWYTLGAGRGAPIYTRASYKKEAMEEHESKLRVAGACGPETTTTTGRCRASGDDGVGRRRLRVPASLPVPGLAHVHTSAAARGLRATGTLGVGWSVEAINHGNMERTRTGW